MYMYMYVYSLPSLYLLPWCDYMYVGMHCVIHTLKFMAWPHLFHTLFSYLYTGNGNYKCIHSLRTCTCIYPYPLSTPRSLCISLFMVSVRSLCVWVMWIFPLGIPPVPVSGSYFSTENIEYFFLRTCGHCGWLPMPLYMYACIYECWLCGLYCTWYQQLSFVFVAIQ